MKFLCVACDEAMTLNDVHGPDAGAMTVVFGCPSCGTEVAMLTNPMETQVVRSLGVSIGTPAAAPSPMSTVRTGLAGAHGATEPQPSNPPAESKKSASKCPFTGVVDEAFAARAAPGPSWTPEAEARLARIPAYARAMVREGIEVHAREQGYAEIDDAVMDEMRSRFGM